MNYFLDGRTKDGCKRRPVFIAISKEAGHHHMSRTVIEYLRCAGFAFATAFSAYAYDIRIFSGNDVVR